MTESSSDLVAREQRGAVAILRLSHPPVNVLSRRVLDRLIERLDEIESDPETRVVVLTSSTPRAFAAGADIHEMAPMDPPDAQIHGRRGQTVTTRIERLPLPVIAQVHGVCLGGACEIALACDFVIASDDAMFGQPEINLGVMPGWGGTQRLPRRIGASQARYWIMTGKPIPAAQAAAQGWVLRVVPRGELETVTFELANELATKPPVALAAAKYALNRAIDRQLGAGLDYELELWARLFGTTDQKEGMRAFIEKRPFPRPGRPNWEAQSTGFPWSEREPEPPSSEKSTATSGGKQKN